MPVNLESYEVIYTHPGGAVVTFVRQGGELDALAKGLDSEQFWVFKNVKALLARTDEGDLEEAGRLMAGLGFSSRTLELAEPSAVSSSASREVSAALANAPDPHAHAVHLPGPSYWPILLGVSILIALSGLLFVETTLLITALGLVFAFLCGVGWGMEPI